MTADTLPLQSLRLSIPERVATSDIVMGRGALDRVPELLSAYRHGRLLLVSDQHTRQYAARLFDLLNESGFIPHLLTIPASEDAKTVETLLSLCRECRSLEVVRDDVVVAVGGGMVGDVAGMLAGTYLRGLEFVQASSSLVAMVSASFGGKTGVNFMDYKNLIGAFKQPSLVIIDPLTLDTLPPVEYRSGLGELITVGVLGAPEIFESLASNGAADLDSLIWGAIRCKGEIVEADPFDRCGIRAKLNLGHTFGHALEKLSDFTLPHGIAVAIGLHVATRLAVELKLCSAAIADRVRRTLIKLDLPVTIGRYEPREIIEAMRADKKRAGGRLRFVLPVAIGEVVLFDENEIPPRMLEGLLRTIMMEGQG